MVDFLERMESAGRKVEPLANGEIIDPSNVPAAIVRYVRSDRMKPGEGQTRDWQKHIFRMPSGETFALGGCMSLDTRLRSCKAGDILGLAYRGLKPIDADRSQHDWSVTLIAVKPDELRALVTECGPVYRAIAEAVALKSQERLSSGRPTINEGPTYNDDDAKAAFAW